MYLNEQCESYCVMDLFCMFNRPSKNGEFIVIKTLVHKLVVESTPFETAKTTV